MKKTPKSKRIVFLTRLFHPHIGGVEKHVDKISQGLLRKGCDITIITEQYDPSLTLEENYNGVTIRRIPIGKNEKNKKFKIWFWLLKNRQFLSEFDIVHIHDVFFWIIPLTPFLNRRKVFITFHGYEGYPVLFRNKMMRKSAENYCSGNICVGDFMRKWYGTDPDYIIYGAVDAEKHPKEVLKPYSALFFGRLDDQTGINEYLEGFLRLKDKYKTFTFKAVGEGKYADKLPKKYITSFKSDVSKYIQNNHFVFVSRYLSMLEAMAQRRLVIAVHNDPIKRDYLFMSPFKKYIEICKSSDEIIKKVDYYIKNPEKEKKKVERAYRWAEMQNWEKVANLYIRLWKKG